MIDESDEAKRTRLVADLRAEFSHMKKKVTMDNYFATLADKRILSNEIEKEIIKASVRALDAETSALCKCFTLVVPKIQQLIHPF